jgi:putative NIF3 family GTP cyclohydrolase 1 type 2
VLSEPTTLGQFADRVAAALPHSVWGIRVAGDATRPVRVVAVCGGSGASYLDDAERSGADVYVTADLKHHTAVEAVSERGAGAMALIDAAHWATEAPWLDSVAARLRARFASTVEVSTSAAITDPWTSHHIVAPN